MNFVRISSKIRFSSYKFVRKDFVLQRAIFTVLLRTWERYFLCHVIPSTTWYSLILFRSKNALYSSKFEIYVSIWRWRSYISLRHMSSSKNTTRKPNSSLFFFFVSIRAWVNRNMKKKNWKRDTCCSCTKYEKNKKNHLNWWYPLTFAFVYNWIFFAWIHQSNRLASLRDAHKLYLLWNFYKDYLKVSSANEASSGKIVFWHPITRIISKIFPSLFRVSHAQNCSLLTWIGELACTHRRVINVRQRINPSKNWSLHFSRILPNESYCVRWFTICKLLVHSQKNVNRSSRNLNARLEKSFRLPYILNDSKKWPSLKDHIQSDSRKTVAVEI